MKPVGIIIDMFKPGTDNPRILEAVKDATAKGMDSWQANLRIDEAGVGLHDYFKIKIC